MCDVEVTLPMRMRLVLLALLAMQEASAITGPLQVLAYVKEENEISFRQHFVDKA
jgi:hypothetical protein